MKRSPFNLAILFTLLAVPQLTYAQAQPEIIPPTPPTELSLTALHPAAPDAAPSPSAPVVASFRAEIEKTKKLSRTFKVSASDKLEIDNKFGKVHINTWDKNEISVEVEMIARANSEERAQNLLNKMDVSVNQSGSLISFRTELGSMNTKGKNTESFRINYTVSMPKANPLRLRNGFGDSYLANFQGKADLDISYGSLKADNLSGNDNTVKVSFGSGSISYVKNGKLDISYSNFTVGNSEVIDLKNDFSDIEIEQVNNLTVRSKYGNVKLGKVRHLQGNSEFSGFRVEELNDRLDMRVQYCGDFEVNKIHRDFKLINLDGGFSTFDLNFENGAAYNFDVDLSFGNLRLDKEGAEFSRIEKKNTSSHHTGKVGKAGSSNVTIRAQYGDVRFDRGN